MEKLAGTSLNVDISKFMGGNAEEQEKYLKERRQRNDHVLLKMLEEGLNSDIILTARGGSVKAHRCVLSAVSPVFQAMFQHDMQEQLSSTVDIPDMTIEALQLFLLVLYTVDVFTIDKYRTPTGTPIGNLSIWLFYAGVAKHFDEFFRALLKYQAFRRRLEYLVVFSLERILTPDNCWEYYDISLQFSEKVISMTVWEYIVENFQDILQSAEFLPEMKRNPDRVYSILNEGLAFSRRYS